MYPLYATLILFLSKTCIYYTKESMNKKSSLIFCTIFSYISLTMNKLASKLTFYFQTLFLACTSGSTNALIGKSKYFCDFIVQNSFSVFGPGGLRAPCVAWPLLSPSFSLFSSSFFSLSLSPFFAFDPLRGNSRVRNNLCPNILA